MNELVDPGHGHSPAAWIAVTIMVIALTAGTVFTFFAQWALVIASGVVVLLGWGAGFALSAAGWGAKGPKYQPKDSH
jgi:hypothetical protein